MEAINLAEYPVEELCDAFNTESHTELINNTPITTNKTTVAHNRAVGQIRRALEQFIESNNGNCEVFSENVALWPIIVSRMPLLLAPLN